MPKNNNREDAVACRAEGWPMPHIVPCPPLAPLQLSSLTSAPRLPAAVREQSTVISYRSVPNSESNTGVCFQKIQPAADGPHACKSQLTGPPGPEEGGGRSVVRWVVCKDFLVCTRGSIFGSTHLPCFMALCGVVWGVRGEVMIYCIFVFGF